MVNVLITPTRMSRLFVTNRGYLLLAAVFHITITSTVFMLGRLQVLPNNFNRDGTAQFATDSHMYLVDAVNLANQLKQAGVAAWAGAPYPIHTKLYSLLLAALGPLLGYNILAVEPLNLLSYLAIVWLVFKLGSEVSGERTGRLAAIIVAVLPTFLLHTTQVLKDGLFITFFLGLIFLALYARNRSLSRGRGLVTGLLAGLLTMLLFFIRPNHGVLILMIVLMGVIFQCLRSVQLRQVMIGNLMSVIVLLVSALGSAVLALVLIRPIIDPKRPRLQAVSTRPTQPISTIETTGEASAVNEPASRSTLIRLREGISFSRYLFVRYPGTSSNIDADVRFEGWGDILRYLPRAAEIGLLAPFPNMWLASGTQVGRIGRSISGFEMLMMYVVMVLAIWGLWKEPNRLTVWLLVTTAVFSLCLFGLVITNIGALYRMRYPYWFLLIICGVDSALRYTSLASVSAAASAKSAPSAPAAH